MSDEENFEDIIDELSRLKNHVFSHCEDLNYLFNNSPLPETPDDIHFLSHLPRAWKCKQGHEFTESVYNRTQNNAGCKECE